MTEQLLLNMNRKSAEASKGKTLAWALETHLLAIPTGTGWRTRKELADAGFSPRDCRMARQYSDGAIISGQKGYKATGRASMEEIRLALNTLSSMAEELLKERLQLSKRYHKMQESNMIPELEVKS